MDLTAVLPLVVAGILILLGVLAGFAWINAQDRRTAYRSLAARQGWTYVERDDTWTTRFDQPPFGHGFDRRAGNVLTGVYDERGCVAFDYRYSTQGDGDESPGSPTSVPLDHPSSVVALATGAAFPALSVTPEDVLARAVGRLTDHDIELESDDFNRAFTVICPDRKFASDVLNPQTMQLLLGHRDLGWRFENGYLLTTRPGSSKPETIEGTLATLAAILDGIPAFVWTDHAGGSPGGANSA